MKLLGEGRLYELLLAQGGHGPFSHLQCGVLIKLPRNIREISAINKVKHRRFVAKDFPVAEVM